MKMYQVEDKKNKILCGEALTELKKFPDECIDMIITSPPYYSLRRYGDYKEQIGLEDTFEIYLDKIMAIMKEIKRVVKKEGTIWINMGDCYGIIHKSGTTDKEKRWKQDKGLLKNEDRGRAFGKEKCLLMMSERFAIRCSDELGLILRNKCVWAKQILVKKENRTMGSVMPTSVHDRFNENWEYLYFFVKQKKYYSNLDAVRLLPQTFENREMGIIRQKDYPESKYNKFNYRVRDAKRKLGQPQFKASEEEIKRYNEIPKDYGKKKLQNLPDKGKGLNRWMSGTPNFIKQKSLKVRMEDTKNKDQKSSRAYNIKKLLSEVRLGIKPNTGMTKRENVEVLTGRRRDVGLYERMGENPTGKNLPSVWLIGSEPHNFQKEGFSQDTDHFAIFPQALLEIPIKFSSPPGGIILDPFMGSGTTALMAP